ncbi:TetR/AcrR family transcriptional regulator [Devosia sp. Root635]|uniref:TetR/AcrR family transcriptional regulator n=1 Tax=Devosia sp. Root635 TaxID=1736575 RepID=UPI0006F1D6A9|nr:TetR/AcrR family transcriptional regulator [Devosia sp. Root635]KRA42130.1 TetR family transcriptional regulator [Devosia sp. Root635]
MTETTKKFRRRAEARPDEVLDAALSVFVAKGFAAAKVDDIARQAGVSKGTVYLYFPSKEALLEGIVQRAVSPIADRAAPDMAQFEGDPRVPITRLLHMLCGVLTQADTIAIPKLILREVMNFPAIAEMYRRNVLDKVVPVLTGLIARGIAQGYLRPVDPELTIRSVVGPIIAHIALSEIFDIRPIDGLAMERLVENHIDILFRGICADPQEARP